MPSTIQRRAWHMYRHAIESTRTLQWQQTIAGKNYIFFLDTCIHIAAFVCVCTRCIKCRRNRTHAWMKIAAYRCRRYGMRQLLPRQCCWISVAADKCFCNVFCAENIRNELCNIVALSMLVRRYLRAECPRHVVYNTEEDMHTHHDSIHYPSASALIQARTQQPIHHQKQQLITESCSHLHSSACRVANRTQTMQAKSHPCLDENSCIPLSMVCYATTFATRMLLDKCSSRQMFP